MALDLFPTPPIPPPPAGKWNEQAQELLGKLLPITHLLHAAGSQEAPPAAPKPKKDEAGPKKS